MPPKDKVLLDIRGKIEREQKLIQGFQAVKRNTSNQEVIQRCNNQIRETQSNIDYLEDTMKKMSIQNDSRENDSQADEQRSRRNRVTSSVRPLYSRFDLIKYDCPSLGHKIQYMLQQLQFKLQVENQYREANEKISHLYLMDGDKMSSNAARGGKLESDQRILLLNKALRKYQGMHVNVEEINRDMEIMNMPKYARKAFTGRLSGTVTCIRDVDHIALPTFNRKPESFVCIKIDDVEKARTGSSRTGKFNEDFVVDVDKANEMEIAVYDKNGAQNCPVAFAWILLSDISEEIRKKKVAAEMGSEGWMPASSLPQQNTSVPQPAAGAGAGAGARPPAVNASSYGSNHLATSTANLDGETVTSTQRSSADDAKTYSVGAWVNLEPVGQILVTLTLEKTKSQARPPFMGALGRHGAIRQKPEEVFEQHGHHFVQKQFYNIMCCAFCGEFLRYTGFQCQDCRFLCHKKCYQKVVTKCISKSGDSADDEAKLNHHIPHRFEPVANRGTKWCCHCGHILPWGRKNVRKCSECGVMCHAQCTHLVPDFCGMSMEMANKILTTIKSTKPAAKSPSKQPPIQPKLQQRPSQPPLQPHSHSNSHLGSLPPTPQKYTNKPPPTNVVPHQHTQGLPSDINPRDATYERLFEKEQPQVPDEQLETPFEVKLPTHTSGQFQQTVEPPHQRTNVRRPPPAEPEFTGQPDQMAVDEPTNDRHDLTMMEPLQEQNYPSSEVPVSREKDPFSDSNRRKSEALFENFDYRNDHSMLADEGQQIAIPDAIAEAGKANHRQSQSQSQVPRQQKQKRRRRKVGLDDFQFLAVLGKGNFGKVMLAESRHTSQLCAIKVLKKDFIVENEESESVRSEKQVFLTANKEKHPFLLNLHCCFQTENRIYFVMEYVSGGDLMWHIQKSRFSARRAKFYACEVLVALKYFHDNGIIYRDLKLDNILLTTQGHIKIGDYGLCKENMWYKNTTGTFCGTPDFMAPEIVAGKQYDRSVDWWAFGVLMFQMLLCQSPFKGDDEDDIFNAIEHDDVRYPISMPRQTVLVLQALLTKEPSQRLGSSERDALEIMEHPYFQDVNFDDVLNMRIQPPYLPEVSSEHDYSNFDQEFTSETPRLTPVETVLTSEMQEQFRGFSHIADDAPV